MPLNAWIDEEFFLAHSGEEMMELVDKIMNDPGREGGPSASGTRTAARRTPACCPPSR